MTCCQCPHWKPTETYIGKCDKKKCETLAWYNVGCMEGT